MNYGVIDVGSNTVRLCVYDVSADGKKFKTIMNRKTMAGLASYVRDGKISEEGIAVAAGKHRQMPQACELFETGARRRVRNGGVAQYIEQRPGDCGH